MKKLTIPLLLIALLFAFAGKTIEDIPNGNKKDKEESGGDGGKKELLYKWEKERTSLLDYHNMVLIYSGGSHRKYKWDEETIQPYVTYTDESGTEHWLFDSFLFLEIHDGAGKMFAKGYTSQPANQRDWKISCTTTLNLEPVLEL